MNTPLLSVRALQINAGSKLLCRELDLDILPGQFWCVLGRNGAGKSTLLHTLAGLRRPQAGRIVLDGSDVYHLPVTTLAQRRGLLLQQQHDAFSSTVLDTVLAGRHPFLAGTGWGSDEDESAARRALEAVGMLDSASHDVTQLSGGERQRVAFATLLAQDPQLLLLDEPTAHQDVAAQLRLMQLLQSIVTAQPLPEAQGKAAIATCHDINLAARFATHVLILANGMHWLGTTDQVLLPPVLQEAFGCAFYVTQTQQGKLFVPSAT